jgi:hydroxycarboxylate dehydrogenase B
VGDDWLVPFDRELERQRQHQEPDVMPKAARIRIAVEPLTRHVTEVFAAIGSPRDEAAIVAEELVLADRMGVHSHGISRVGEYLGEVRSGGVVPGGPCALAGEFRGTAIVDGGNNFGQVVARFALGIGAERAREFGISCTVTRNCYHVGRIGAISERAAKDHLICFATVAGGFPGVVAPWGGIDGLLGTNPVSFGVPHASGAVVCDFATSTMSEGATRLAFRDGRKVPEGTVIAADGSPSTEPRDLYGDPPGALLPFGGPVGYKGYALNILPELTAATLAGYGPDPSRPCNCLFMVLVDPRAFLPMEQFLSLASGETELIKSSRPRPGEEVLLPGEREARCLAENQEAVTLPADVYDSLLAISRELAVDPDLTGG